MSMFTTGRTISPHQLNSEGLIKTTLQNFSYFLSDLFNREGAPALITISRSMKFDYYLPSHDLASVEQGVLRILHSLLAPHSLKVLCYLEQSEEVTIKEIGGELQKVAKGEKSRIVTENCHLDHEAVDSAKANRRRRRIRTEL